MRAAAVEVLAGVQDFETVQRVADSDSTADVRALAVARLPKGSAFGDIAASSRPK